VYGILDIFLVFANRIFQNCVEIVFRKECMYFVGIFVIIYNIYGLALINWSDRCIFCGDFVVETL